MMETKTYFVCDNCKEKTLSVTRGLCILCYRKWWSKNYRERMKTNPLFLEKRRSYVRNYQNSPKGRFVMARFFYRRLDPDMKKKFNEEVVERE